MTDRKRIAIFFVLPVLALLLCLPASPRAAAADWPQFRGPDDRASRLTRSCRSRGMTARTLPGGSIFRDAVHRARSWSASDVILTATTGYRHDRLHVLCFDTATGKQLWDRQFWATGRTATHDCISAAAPTPASDGQYVYASFSSNDSVLHRPAGQFAVVSRLELRLSQSRQRRGDGLVAAGHGRPRDRPIGKPGGIVRRGIDASTGETRWQIDRPNRGCWSSPVALPRPRQSQAGRPAAIALPRDGGRSADRRNAVGV